MRDRGSGRAGTFTGVALYKPNHDGGLDYREDGTMEWGDHAGSAYREYVLRPTEDAAAMDMFFLDGRPFHRMGFAAMQSSDQHWCDPDTYVVHYEWLGPDEFSYVWDIRGPAKDLLLESRLRRNHA